MKRLLFVLVLCLASAGSSSAQQIWTMQWQGVARTVIVHFPPSRPGQTGLPVVFALQGWTTTAEKFADSVTCLHLLGDTVGFITVYPEAVDLHWNSGIGDSPRWLAPNVDDVGFISRIIDSLISRFAIDTQRVYSCGMSNGGFMSFKLAAQLSNRIAAIASVAGVMTTSTATNYSARRPVPVLMVHGTADPNVPYNGGEAGWYSVDETQKFWIMMNNCFLPPDTLTLPDLDPNDQSTVVRYRHRSSSNASEVVLFKVIGGGHTYPGSYILDWASLGVGPKNGDINANNEMWNFFKKFSLGVIASTYVHDVVIDRRYARPGKDSVCITTALSNPLHHVAAVSAIVTDTLGATRDSVLLLNDGLHGDGTAGDSVWGCRIRAPLDEGLFDVSVLTADATQGTLVRLPKAQRFLTNGPIVCIGWTTTTSDTIAHPGDVLRVKCRVANVGKSDKVKAVTVTLSSLDTLTWIGLMAQLSYGDLAPGQQSEGSSVQGLKIQPTCPPNTRVRLLLKISTQGFLAWTDTISITVQATATKVTSPNTVPTRYSLDQNYPNPFNPSTTISYDLPKAANVTLKVYNTLGQLVASLVDEHKEAGSYQVQWNANVPSGIYFYRLQAGEFVETKKMILLR
jgi:polyhydroxybutyrate depolymerase